MFEELIPIEPCSNKAYLKWICEKDCLICGSPYVIPHHCEGILPARGMGVKHDLLAVPLCDECHTVCNNSAHLGSVLWDSHQIDIKARIIFFLITYFGRKR